MKHKLIIVICLTLIISMFSGCQLAKENLGHDPYADRLIGFFITLKPLHNYYDDSLNDYNIDRILSRQTQPIERIYATIVSKTQISEITGELFHTEEYIFEGINGLAFFGPTVPAIDGREQYFAIMADDTVCDIHHSISSDSSNLKGTIYVTPSTNYDVLHLNPVFQSTDGSVYVIPGGYAVFIQPGSSEGISQSFSNETTSTTTVNGESKTYTSSVEISIGLMFSPVKIVILQMDANNQLVSRTDFMPGTLPPDFTPAPNTNYIIVETHKSDLQGNPVITREIYSGTIMKKDALIATFSARDDGFCTKNCTQLKWQ